MANKKGDELSLVEIEGEWSINSKTKQIYYIAYQSKYTSLKLYILQQSEIFHAELPNNLATKTFSTSHQRETFFIFEDFFYKTVWEKRGKVLWFFNAPNEMLRIRETGWKDNCFYHVYYGVYWNSWRKNVIYIKQLTF